MEFIRLESIGWELTWMTISWIIIDAMELIWMGIGRMGMYLDRK